MPHYKLAECWTTTWLHGCLLVPNCTKLVIVKTHCRTPASVSCIGPSCRQRSLPLNRYAAAVPVDQTPDHDDDHGSVEPTHNDQWIEQAGKGDQQPIGGKCLNPAEGSHSQRGTRISEQYFPALCESNDDPRASLLFEDGIQWIKDADPESLDVIIVDSTDPIGPAEGLFTEAFYRDCHKALRDGGILIQQSESPLLHMHIIKAMHQAMRAAGYQETHTLHFPQVSYPSGWWCATMAGKGRDLGEFREQDVCNKSFETLYYNAGIHRGALAAPEFFQRALAEL